MRNVLLVVVTVSMFVALSGEASARPRLFKRSVRSSSVSHVSYSSPQEAATAKANIAARLNRKGHMGGNFGGGRAEGTGFSSRSPQEALNMCCFTGERRLAASCVVRGTKGWYACKIYW